MGVLKETYSCVPPFGLSLACPELVEGSKVSDGVSTGSTRTVCCKFW